MNKVLIAVGGIFVGAFVVEVLHRKHPELTTKIEEKAKQLVDALTSPAKADQTEEPEPQE